MSKHLALTVRPSPPRQCLPHKIPLTLTPHSPTLSIHPIPTSTSQGSITVNSRFPILTTHQTQPMRTQTLTKPPKLPNSLRAPRAPVSTISARTFAYTPAGATSPPVTTPNTHPSTPRSRSLLDLVRAHNSTDRVTDKSRSPRPRSRCGPHLKRQARYTRPILRVTCEKPHP